MAVLVPQAARGAEPGSFAPTGSMGIVRFRPAAASLPDGRVLVAGGENAVGNPVDTAELFDPDTGSFSNTGSMGTMRQGAAAALLAGGRVLVTGGIGPASNFLSSAEVYDAATNSFSVTGPMDDARHLPAAAPLPDGKILVAGGRQPAGESFTNLSTAEVYDPFTSSFGDTGSMGTARWAAAAAPLGDGRVLVAGGIDAADTYLSTAELYDPVTGTFSPTSGSMGVARAFAAAAPLPDGRVLVVGGQSASDGSDLASAEVFDPDTGTFSSVGIGSMSTARRSPASAPTSGGRILVAGGYNGNRLDTAEIFTLHAFQPDGRIRLGNGSWKGADVHNEDAAGQTISTRARRGRTKTFVIRVVNHGSIPDSFTIQGPGGTSERWIVKYLFAGVDVTSQVDAGTFDFYSAILAPGKYLNMNLKITPRRTARVGSVKSVLVTVATDGDPDAKDAVKARVTVRRG